MPPAAKKKKRSGKKASTSTSRRVRVVKGRVNLKVAGYSGLQKLAPLSLIPYLPAGKLRQAAKRALGALGKEKKVVRRKRKGGKKK